MLTSGHNKDKAVIIFYKISQKTITIIIEIATPGENEGNCCRFLTSWSFFPPNFAHTLTHTDYPVLCCQNPLFLSRSCSKLTSQALPSITPLFLMRQKPGLASLYSLPILNSLSHFKPAHQGTIISLPAAQEAYPDVPTLQLLVLHPNILPDLGYISAFLDYRYIKAKNIEESILAYTVRNEKYLLN